MKQKDLDYFKELLLQRKTQIEQNIEGYSREMMARNELEPNDEGDLATISADNMLESALSNQQRQELSEILVALRKMGEGGYGTCEMCEEPIGIPRLKVKPHAKYCIVCREIVEKRS